MINYDEPLFKNQIIEFSRIPMNVRPYILGYSQGWLYLELGYPQGWIYIELGYLQGWIYIELGYSKGWLYLELGY